jgi:hypothetical protein
LWPQPYCGRYIGFLQADNNELASGLGLTLQVTGVGAFLAIRAAMDAHDITGTVTLIGTPAEEGGAGKCKLYDIGACKYLPRERDEGRRLIILQTRVSAPA